MRYFIVNLAVHLMITAMFSVLTCVFAGRNRRKKTKHVLSYFFPIAFALVAIIDISLYTAPRLMDVNSMINNNFFYTTGSVDSIGIMRNYFVIDGKYYYLNPIHNTLKVNDVVRVAHTPYSSFTVDITKTTDNVPHEDGDLTEATD
ncbi:MAG: hypothetical protein K6E72_10330 [Saccharofermentans sp.]|jgi:hypothetical protein|nr:hypothetical protein [Saccharofermentans sp.]